MNFEDPEKTAQYTYQDSVPSGVLEGLEIRLRNWKRDIDRIGEKYYCSTR